MSYFNEAKILTNHKNRPYYEDILETGSIPIAMVTDSEGNCFVKYVTVYIIDNRLEFEYSYSMVTPDGEVEFLKEMLLLPEIKEALGYEFVPVDVLLDIIKKVRLI